MKMKKFKGIVILTNAGSSGDFISNFIKCCLLEEQPNFIDNNLLSIKSESNIATFYFPYNKNEHINNIQQILGWNQWQEINLSILDQQFFNYFQNDSNSIVHMHVPYYEMNFTNVKLYNKFYHILNCLNNNDIKIYYINFSSKNIAAFTYYVKANNQREHILFKQYKKACDNKKYFDLQMNILEIHNEQIIDDLKKHGILYEEIFLDNLLLNRNYDSLYDQINISFPLKSYLSDENKKITNELWDDRINHLKKLGWW